MKKIFFTLSIIYSFAVFNTLCAQVYINENIVFENFEYSVKQMSEFMERFNLTETLIKPDEDSLWRFTNRVLLFEKKTYYSNIELADEMINAIDKNNITLNFRDSTWLAVIRCNVLFQGKKDTLLIYLKTEQTKNDAYKWSIVDVQGNIVNLTPKTNNENIRISPVDNEMHFMSLKSHLSANAKNITLFSTKNYTTDRLSVFNAYIYADILKIQDFVSLTYIFDKVDGYEFCVDYFNRDENNSGWLISKIKRTENDCNQK